MTDMLSPERRSENMRRIGGRNTGPERAVRRALHALGFRFRLHRADLPGRPDIVLPRHRAAIFVHGCFWHRHEGCAATTTPSTRREFWLAKFAANTARDARQQALLQAAGWTVLIVWGCETRRPADLSALLTRRLTDAGVPPRGRETPGSSSASASTLG